MDILDQCIRGDRMAQKALYQQYKNKMFVLCLRYANSREDAEDILQEGFVKVFRDLHQYTGAGNLEGWIRKVILNVALQYIRKQKQLKMQLTSDFEQWENVLMVDNGEESFDKELVKKILHLMQQMPIGFRTVLNLYIMEEYSHQQIADELGISVGTSKSQLNRAKAYLRELVDRVMSDQ
ncbi:MAG: RNA polymerase sigma factor [Saprospiraceae bacterium]